MKTKHEYQHTHEKSKQFRASKHTNLKYKFDTMLGYK